jgi:hypothetical protein
MMVCLADWMLKLLLCLESTAQLNEETPAEEPEKLKEMGAAANGSQPTSNISFP